MLLLFHLIITLWGADGQHALETAFDQWILQTRCLRLVERSHRAFRSMLRQMVFFGMNNAPRQMFFGSSNRVVKR